MSIGIYTIDITCNGVFIRRYRSCLNLSDFLKHSKFIGTIKGGISLEHVDGMKSADDVHCTGQR